MNQIRIRRKPTTAACALGVAQSAGLLGNAYDPYTMYDDPAA